MSIANRIMVENAWARWSRAIERALTGSALLKREKLFGKLSVAINREFDEMPRLLEETGAPTTAATKRGRLVILDSIHRQQIWRAAHFASEVAQLHPSPTDGFHVVRLEVIAWARGLKHTADLSSQVTDVNRGDIDTPDMQPRFYHRPQLVDQDDAKARFDELAGRLRDIGTQRNVRLFSIEPEEALAEANRLHGTLTREGVGRYETGMASAYEAATVEARLADEIRALVRPYRSFLEAAAMLNTEQSARLFLAARGVKEQGNIAPRLVAAA